MFRISRGGREGGDPWIGWKIRAFSVGAGLAIGALILDSKALALAAIGILFLGFGLRFFAPSEPFDEAAEEAEEDAPPQDPPGARGGSSA